MEQIEIIKLWKKSESLLHENRMLNLKLLKEIKLEKAKSSLKGLLFLPISSLVFYTILGFYALYFSISYSQHWYFTFSGVVVAFFSFWLVWSSIKQLKLIFSIDYSESVVNIQKKLAKLKISVVQNLRIVAWLLPFGPFVGVFVIKVIFHVDIMSLLDFNMIISFGILTVLLEVISLILLNALRPKRISSKWLNWLLSGSGSQVNEALKYLSAIEDFQKETPQ